MISHPSSQLLQNAAFVSMAAWVIGHAAKDVLKVIGDVVIEGVRMIKVVKDHLQRQGQ